MIPVVATRDHLDFIPTAPDHDDVLDGRCAGNGFVGRCFEWKHLAAPIATVGGDEDLCLGIVDAVRQRLGAESAEHDAVRRPDARTCQHRNRGFRDHRQVDVDPVAALDAELFEGIRESLYLVEQIGVGQHAAVAGLALPVEGDLVAPTGLDMPVEAVVAHVELPADEPLGVRQLPLTDRVPLSGPRHQVGRLTRPEALIVLVGLVVQRRVGHKRLTLEVGGRRELAVLQHQVVDGVVVVAHVAHVVTPTGHVSETAQANMGRRRRAIITTRAPETRRRPPTSSGPSSELLPVRGNCGVGPAGLTAGGTGDKLAKAATSMDAVAVLLAGTGSEESDDTEAVLLAMPRAAAAAVVT